jgi:hypothetical protein
MQTAPKMFVDTLVLVRDNPAALVTLIALAAFCLIGVALYVVLAAIKRN